MINTASTKGKIHSFTDLASWRESHKFVLMIYQIKKQFPEEEKFALSVQLSRAAVSITSNIAEGFSRKSSKEKRQFYTTALASLTEVQNQLLIAKDVEYISKENFNTLAQQSVYVSRLINGLIKSAPEKPNFTKY